MESILEIANKLNEKFGWLGAWLSVVLPVCGTFLYVHRENIHLTERLDDHITEIHKRTDDLDRKWSDQWARINDRFLESDKKFYELLKEMRKFE